MFDAIRTSLDPFTDGDGLDLPMESHLIAAVK
jgi:hypothetical protein